MAVSHPTAHSTRDARSDPELVEAAQAGDETAFGAIYERYLDRIHDFCTAMLRDRDAAADAAQDTFLIAYRKLGVLRDAAKLRAWLFAIARNEALHRKRRTSEVVGEATDEPAIDPDDAPEQIAARRDVQTLVWEAADGLSPRDRAVLHLHVRHGLDGQELADALGVDRAHAYVLVSNARDRVDRSLGALLVARLGRGSCPELDAIVSNWDGELTPRLRKRVARHIDGCSVCSDTRERRLNPAALLGAVPLVAAPAVMHETWTAPDAGAAEIGPLFDSETGFPPPTAPRGGVPSPVPIVALVLAVLGVLVIAGGVALVVAQRSGDPASEPASPVTGESVEAGGGGDVVAPVAPVAEDDYCTVATEFQVEIGASGPADPSPQAFQAYFETTLAYLDRLVPIAPPEIGPDVTALRDGIAGLAAGADPSAPNPGLAAARRRFEEFNSRSC